MKYKIIWQHWKAPFENEFGLPNQQDLELLNQPIIKLLGSPDDFDQENIDENHLNIIQDGADDKKFIKGVYTPVGLFPINENYNPFNFWYGHCNFYVNEDILNLLDKCDGVESLEVWTPYRFKIAIAKAFNEKEVMLNIQKKLFIYMKEVGELLNGF